MRKAWNKGSVVADWDKKVNEALGGRFDLVSRISSANGESKLIIKCKKCGAERIISSVSLRSANKTKVMCRECKKSETASWHEFEKWQRDLQKIAEKNRKKTQMSFRFCKDCGMIISSTKASLCELCSIKHIRQNDRNKEHKRRIREHRVFDKTITLEELYKRDHGICYLCNRTCDWSDFQKVNGSFVVGGSYPTVEHVKALANGGTHTWDNVRLACHACNAKKGYERGSPL